MGNSPVICAIGTGYVGMASMIGLAELGWAVRGYDVLADRIARLKIGITPYHEAAVEELLQKHLANDRLTFHHSLEEAVTDVDIIVIAVGTPSRDDGSADLSALHIVMDELRAIQFSRPPTIAIRSTVPPGTSDMLAAKVGDQFDIVYAPEFLREGSAVFDFLNPDRIVVGAENVAAAVRYVRLFESLQSPVVLTSRCNAELIKCASNAFLALKISFANQVANLCDALGATSDDVMRGIGYDRRIGAEFLRPGIGFGGPCFEKDVKSIDHVATLLGVPSDLFQATLAVNNAQPRRIVGLLQAELGDLSGVEIGIWGLAFKAGTDDIRDSLAVRIVQQLSDLGAHTVIYDPMVHVAPLPPNSRLVQDAHAAADADALLVLTEWNGFNLVDPMSYASTLRRKVVVDGRNTLSSDRVVAAGLRYRGVGRESPPALVDVDALPSLSAAR